MENYYAIQNLKKVISDLDFLKLQRMVYPIMKDKTYDLNLISAAALENYFERLTNEGIDVDDFDIDKWLSACVLGNMDEFVHLVNPEIPFKSFGEYDDKDIANTYDKVFLSTYYGLKTILKEDVSYMHGDYENELQDILKFLEEKMIVRSISSNLSKYGFDNFDELSYDDISTLLMAILSKCDYGIQVPSITSDIYRLLQIYDNKSLKYGLDNLELKYLSNEKLKRLDNVLGLAIMDDDSFNAILESEIDIQFMDLHESNILRSMNDTESIINAYNLTGEEIKRRRNSQFNCDALLLANAIASDMNSGKKRKFKM